MSELLKDQNGNTSSKRVAGYIIGGVGARTDIEESRDLTREAIERINRLLSE